MPRFGAPVTDPKIIAQLEQDAQYAPTQQNTRYGSPVTDPNIISQLESQQNSKSQSAVRT